MHHGVHAACLQLVDRRGLDRDEPHLLRLDPRCCSRNLKESVTCPTSAGTATVLPLSCSTEPIAGSLVTQARFGRSCDERSRPATIWTSSPFSAAASAMVGTVIAIS